MPSPSRPIAPRNNQPYFRGMPPRGPRPMQGNRANAPEKPQQPECQSKRDVNQGPNSEKIKDELKTPKPTNVNIKTEPTLKPDLQRSNEKPDPNALKKSKERDHRDRARWEDRQQMPPLIPPQHQMFYGEEGTGEKQEPKKFTGRCRLFVGNIPSDMQEDEFRQLFVKFGEVGEVFINPSRGFGFVKLDTRGNAEQAKYELDGTMMKGKPLRVRFAAHGAAVRVKNLSSYVSNELLEHAFSLFGRVERAIAIVDERGKPTGEGIVEFERKPAAQQCLTRCNEGCFILTSELKPIIVEPLQQLDEDDGLPEKSISKTNQYFQSRSTAPQFVAPNSFEYDICMKWMELEEQKRQLEEEVKRRLAIAREQLEIEIEQAMIDHQTQAMREDLIRRQNELKHMEEKRQHELERRKQMVLMRHGEEKSRNFERYDSNTMNQNLPFQNPSAAQSSSKMFGAFAGPQGADNRQVPVSGGERPPRPEADRRFTGGNIGSTAGDELKAPPQGQPFNPVKTVPPQGPPHSISGTEIPPPQRFSAPVGGPFPGAPQKHEERFNGGRDYPPQQYDRKRPRY